MTKKLCVLLLKLNVIGAIKITVCACVLCVSILYNNMNLQLEFSTKSPLSVLMLPQPQALYAGQCVSHSLTMLVV